MVNCLSMFMAVLATANGHATYWNTPNSLQPVHGLYVKPSVDGTTGDLYVAATEENGVKSQWLTDQPVNFLPAATHTQPIAYSPSIASPEETVNTQKRAVVNPPVQYAYAYPVLGQTEGNSVVPYPYPTSSSSPVPSNPTEICNKGDVPTRTTTTLPQYNPFHYFYPQIISAYSNLMNHLKETENNEEETGSVAPQSPAVWPASYGYPVQYVMVDPNMWAQAQTASQASTSSSTSAGVTANDNE
ncbi:uncharacterized protein LOC131850835 [Achroia grisella]|uniref:uncharacterized protein LOC131850835 n=1 Tax=Achroia grisella TaxID=688607 RepID=UPI0027D26E81|nr:uncharacterized protein LOC131850835 [Achroia grisella]